MLSPKRTKFRKQQRGRMRGNANSGNKISFGQYALQALEPSWITSRQIEAARRAMTRYIRRGGKIWIRVFPDKPVTSTVTAPEVDVPEALATSLPSESVVLYE